MIPEQRKRAGDSVQARIMEMGSTVTAIAKAAGISPRTLSRLIHGDSWPVLDTRERINKALGWPQGELARRAVLGANPCSTASSIEMLDELRRRILEAGI